MSSLIIKLGYGIILLGVLMFLYKLIKTSETEPERKQAWEEFKAINKKSKRTIKNTPIEDAITNAPIIENAVNENDGYE